MISNDKSAVANMPQHVVYKSYEKADYGRIDERLNDDMSGIDDQMSKDESKGRAKMNPTKY